MRKRDKEECRTVVWGEFEKRKGSIRKIGIGEERS